MEKASKTYTGHVDEMPSPDIVGEIDRMESADLLKRGGMGAGVLPRPRRIIRKCKADERMRKPQAPPLRVRPPRRPARLKRGLSARGRANGWRTR